MSQGQIRLPLAVDLVLDAVLITQDCNCVKLWTLNFSEAWGSGYFHEVRSVHK